jgi:hypothetical protein
VNRRGFFTVVGAAVAAAHASDEPIAVSPNTCILCGFGERLKPWGPHNVMRCTDSSGCQARQINALLGTRTPWQERTGVVVAKGKAVS